jgi:hypothetical protein
LVLRDKKVVGVFILRFSCAASPQEGSSIVAGAPNPVKSDFMQPHTRIHGSTVALALLTYSTGFTFGSSDHGSSRNDRVMYYGSSSYYLTSQSMGRRRFSLWRKPVDRWRNSNFTRGLESSLETTGTDSSLTRKHFSLDGQTERARSKPVTAALPP